MTYPGFRVKLSIVDSGGTTSEQVTANMTPRLVILITIAAATLLISCHTPPDDLSHAPPSTVIDGRTITLSASVWRNVMPPVPPEVRGLGVGIFLDASDTTRPFPAVIETDHVWVVKSDAETWESNLAVAPGPLFPKNEMWRWALDGPQWDPGIYVDVVVRLTDGLHRVWLLRVPHQLIESAN